MDYLRWHKTREAVRYDLCSSGVPDAERQEFDAHRAPVSLETVGAYGHPQLIEALARRYRIPAHGIVPVPGASSANFIAMSAAVGAGATVVLEQPVYQPLRRVAEFLRLRVIPLLRRPETGFSVSPDDVEMGLDQGAAAVVLSNLHNPSGQLLPVERMREIAQRCARVDATLVVDEVYLDAVCLHRDQPCWTAAHLGEGVIAVNSLTKVYGLSSLRVGWLLTTGRLAERARELMDLLSVNNAAPSVSLALRAFANISNLESRYRRFYEADEPGYRRWLAEEVRVTGYPSFGALFELLRLPPGISASRLCEHLAAEYDTLLVPGTFFDLPDHVRLSIALPEHDLHEALSRVSRALDDLSRNGR